MSREGGNVQKEDKREKKSWTFLMRFLNGDDYLLPVSPIFFWMVIDKRQTSINKRVSMNSYMNWKKKCTNLSFLSPATSIKLCCPYWLPRPAEQHQPRQRIDGRDVGSRRTWHMLDGEHMTSLEPGQISRKAWARSNVRLTIYYQSNLG